MVIAERRSRPKIIPLREDIVYEKIEVDGNTFWIHRKPLSSDLVFIPKAGEIGLEEKEQGFKKSFERRAR